MDSSTQAWKLWGHMAYNAAKIQFIALEALLCHHIVIKVWFVFFYIIAVFK